MLLLLQYYHLGYEVGLYISLERLIEQNMERYYETLEQSSQRWHEGKHDPWPYVNYVLFTFKAGYREFEELVRQTTASRGTKAELIIGVIGRSVGPFRVSDIQRECLGVSLDLIRQVLENLRSFGQVECLGRGQNAAERIS